MYKLALSNARSKVTVYVDFSKDTIHFGNLGNVGFDIATLIHNIFRDELNQIRHLSMTYCLYGQKFDRNTKNLAELARVEEFTFVNDRIPYSEARTFDFVEPNPIKELSFCCILWLSMGTVTPWDLLNFAIDQELVKYCKKLNGNTPSIRCPLITFKALIPSGDS